MAKFLKMKLKIKYVHIIVKIRTSKIGGKQMRYKLYFTLENTNMPIDYRRSIISYIKHALQEYDEEYYKKFYNEKDPIIKPYTFAVFFKQPQINAEEIIIEDKRFELNISVEDYETAIILYNSFNKQKYKKFSINTNSFTLKNIEMAMEKEIKDNNITIKFISPLCVRRRQDKKDYYYSFEHEEFEDTLKMNITEQLKITNISSEIVKTLKITPIKAKKVINKFYEKKIECSTGTFALQGDIQLLNYIYKARNGKQTLSRIWNVSSYIK